MPAALAAMPPKPNSGRDQRDDEEDDGVVQHGGSLMAGCRHPVVAVATGLSRWIQLTQRGVAAP